MNSTKQYSVVSAHRVAALSALCAVLAAVACSEDSSSGDTAGTGGTSPGTGGQPMNGTGGRASGGTGGKGSGGVPATGGTAGTGGKGSGGTGGNELDGSRPEGGPKDGGDAGCAPDQLLVYWSPGCDGTVKPVCAGPVFEAGVFSACLCDGTTQGPEGGAPTKPWRYFGACADAAPPDASRDGS